MHIPKWCVFFDFHTQPSCPDVGANFDFDAITDNLKECGVDFIVFAARCNMGMAYYDTKIGIRHPSLKYDLFGKLVEACHKKGIAISAYMNVGLSHEEGLLHRDWTVLTPEGYSYLPNKMGNFFRKMCYNSPYADHLIAMASEVVRNYPVAGMFFDCMGIHECVGVECVREMKRLGLDWESHEVRMDFAHMSQVRIAKKLSGEIKGIRHELLLYFNGLAFEDQRELGSYLEYECLPTGGWGYDSLPVYARYARNLGKPVLNMTGRFHESWGDFGGIRTEASLEYDCLNGLANCMRTTIGDHFHPRGDINKAAFSLYKRIYGRLQKLDPWLDEAKPLTDIALLVPKNTFKYTGHSSLSGIHAASGAARILCELKQQFDILPEDAAFDPEKLVLLCDDVQLAGKSLELVRLHLKAGGHLISSAWSGLDAEKKEFALPEFWHLSYKGESPHNPAYINLKTGFAEDFPDMPLSLYDNGIQVEALAGAEVVAEIVAPYFNRGWDGEHHIFYIPPDKPTGRPALTMTPSLAHFTHPILSSYHKHAQVPIRQLFEAVLKRLLPRPLLRTSGLPSFARATVTSLPKRRMVHLLSYVPERRGAQIDMIEEPVILKDIKVELRLDNLKPERAYLAPDRKPLDFEIKPNGYAKLTVPEMPGHSLLVFEE